MTCCIFSKETAIQDTKKISPVGEKMAEKMSDQKAGETHSLYCSNVYRPLCHKVLTLYKLAVYPSEEDRIVIEIGSSEDEDERSDDEEPCASGQNVAG